MSVPEVAKAEQSPRYVTMDDYNYLNRRINAIDSKLAKIIAILIDKKLIGEELGKRIINEVLEKEDSPLLNWYLKNSQKIKVK